MLRLTPLLLLLPASLLASESTPPVVSAGTYLQATLALLFIVGLLFAATWAARKVSGGKMFGQGNMRVISGIALGPKERIVLVEVEDSWLVIGIVPGQIRTLHTLPKGSAAVQAGTDPVAPFGEWLKAIRERRNAAQ